MTHADTAAELVLGDRNAAYGSPADDFSSVGLMWTALLRRYGVVKPDAIITAEMVALCMVLLKVNRHAHRPKDDNLVDAHGYLNCLEWIETGERPVPEAHRLQKTIDGLNECIEDVCTGGRLTCPKCGQYVPCTCEQQRSNK